MRVRGSIFLLFIFLLLSCEKQNQILLIPNEPLQTISLTPLVSRISDLPDSLRPTKVFLSEHEPPRVIKVPKTKGEYVYERINIAGQRQVIEVEPPDFQIFETLHDEEGQFIVDNSGKPIIIGKGGRSQFKNYTTEDGLPADAIRTLLFDSRGDLWIGTYGGGASRYNGFGFENYTLDHGLPNEVITKIFEDSKGNLWFSSNNGGVSKYDGKKFTLYRTYEGMSSNVIWSIGEDSEGNMWFGTYDAGVVKFDGENFEAFGPEDGLAGNFILGIERDKDGNMWFGGVEGLNSLIDGELKVFKVDDGLPSNAIISIKQEENGPMWFGSVQGLAKFDGNIFENYFVEDGLAEDLVWGISFDPNGKLWLSTAFGISSFDGDKFTSYTKGVGLIDNQTRDIAVGKDGVVWIGTDEGGLSRLDGEVMTNFTKDYGFRTSALMNDIFEDKKGDLWFGSISGLYKYNGYGFTIYSQNYGGLIENTVKSSFQDSKGDYWFAGAKGFSRFDGNEFTHFGAAQGLEVDQVVDIAQDKDGVFWLTFEMGIVRFDGESFIHYLPEHGTQEDIKEIFFDSFGNFWITSWYGLTLFENDSFYHFGPSPDFPVVMSDILQDEKGNLWLATYDGILFVDADQLARLKENPSKTLDFKLLNKEHGLIDNRAIQLLLLPENKMAVGSTKGIQIFDRPIFEGGEFKRITNSEWYHISTGFPIKGIFAQGKNTMFLDKDGVIWAATESANTGLVRFDYKAVKKKSEKPSVRLRNVKINEAPVSWNSILSHPVEIAPEDSTITVAAHVEEMVKYGEIFTEEKRDSLSKYYSGIKIRDVRPFEFIPERLVLPYRFNRLTFEYGTDELAHPELIQYQYFLKGYDRAWGPITNESKVTFGNIREGNYTLQVRARYTGVSEPGADEWTEPIALFSFRVLPPFYRTWWAYIFYGGIFIASFRYYIKRREEALKRRQEQLEETVSIRTAELRAEKKKSDDLLLNILPEEVAEELKAKGNADAQLIDEVTVLFTDFKGFTQLSEILTPKELVAEINECFSAFDYIMQKYGIEKIKTIGDAYMAAGGLPTPNQTHAIDVVRAALEIQKFMQEHKEEKLANGKLFFEIRIGIHTGPVVAGIVGVKKFQYDIWGDTVNTASRMESSGEIGKVNISGMTYEMVKEYFHCTHRGKIQAKGKGEIDMYFVEGEKVSST